MKSISYGRNDCNVIDSGLFASSETIFTACHSGTFHVPSPNGRGLGWGSSHHTCHSEASAEESTSLHVRISPSVSTTFQHNSALLGHEHPPHHHTYFTVSITFSLNFEVTEKYFKADSSNHGEKSITLSISSPHMWIEFGR